MKKIFYFIVPFGVLIILFRAFNNAGRISLESILNVLNEFEFSFDNTVEVFSSIKYDFAKIDFFPISVDSFSTFFKAIGQFFVACYDTFRLIVESISLVFTVLLDIIGIFIDIFNTIFKLFGFNAYIR